MYVMKYIISALEILVFMALFSKCSSGLRILTSTRYNIQSLNDLGLNTDEASSITFQVVACSDVYVVLFDAYTRYEFVFGGWENTASEVRRGDRAISTLKHKPLDCCSFKAFWVSWDGYKLRAGFGFQVGERAFFDIGNIGMKRITKVGVTTGWGFTGVWAMSLDKSPLKPNDFDVNGYVECSEDSVEYYIPMYPTSSEVVRLTSSVEPRLSSETVATTSSIVRRTSSETMANTSSVVRRTSSETVATASSVVVRRTSLETVDKTSPVATETTSSQTVDLTSSENVESTLSASEFKRPSEIVFFTSTEPLGSPPSDTLSSMNTDCTDLKLCTSSAENFVSSPVSFMLTSEPISVQHSDLGTKNTNFIISTSSVRSSPLMPDLSFPLSTLQTNWVFLESGQATRPLLTTESVSLILKKSSNTWSDNGSTSVISDHATITPTDTSILETSSAEMTSAKSSPIRSPTTTPEVIPCFGCPCFWPPYGTVNQSLAEKIERIRATLTLVKYNLSAVRRRLTSAYDVRPSSRYVGASGAAILALVIGLIVLADVQRVLDFLMMRKKRVPRTIIFTRSQSGAQLTRQ